MPYRDDDQRRGTCDICSESFDQDDPDKRPSKMDVAEFWSPNIDDSIVAHAECGINAGYELA